MADALDYNFLVTAHQPLNDWVIFLEMWFYLLMLFIISVTILYQTGLMQWMFSQHCGCWCGAPGHRWPQCWQRTHAFPRCLKVKTICSRKLLWFDFKWWALLLSCISILNSLFPAYGKIWDNAISDNGLVPWGSKPLSGMALSHTENNADFLTIRSWRSHPNAFSSEILLILIIKYIYYVFKRSNFFKGPMC